MRIANTVTDSIVDGPGLRFVVFVQGCAHRCPGCQNPHTHDPLQGRSIEPADLLPYLDNPLLDGLTLSGGEPMDQAGDCAILAAEAKRRGLNVWVYTGYTFDALFEEHNAERMALLQTADVLVDGPFLLAERSLDVPWRGSRNQRLIDLPKSLSAGQPILWQDPKEDLLSKFVVPS